MRFGEPLGSKPWPGALCVTVGAVTGITNRSLRAPDDRDCSAHHYGMTQASYDLARITPQRP